MEIIPAIDIINGKCVRLSQGEYSQKKEYNFSPVEMAKRISNSGITRLHLVDLDGAKAKSVVNLKILEEIVRETDLVIDFGGGIKSYEDLQSVLNSGASMVNIGTLAQKNPDLFFSWLEEFGNDTIILSADAKNGFIAVEGWIETSDVMLHSYLNLYIEKGVKKVVCTDISKDGMMAGSATSLYDELLKENPTMELIASGGVHSMEDLQLLKKIGCHGAIVGKAILEGKLSLEELAKFN